MAKHAIFGIRHIYYIVQCSSLKIQKQTYIYMIHYSGHFGDVALFEKIKNNLSILTFEAAITICVRVYNFSQMTICYGF